MTYTVMVERLLASTLEEWYDENEEPKDHSDFRKLAAYVQQRFNVELIREEG